MDDEYPYRKTEQAEGSEVEVETVRQPRHIRSTLCRAPCEIRRDFAQRRLTHRLLWRKDQTAELPRGVQKALGHRNIGDGRIGCYGGHDNHRCVDCPLQPCGCDGIGKHRRVGQKLRQVHAAVACWSHASGGGERVNPDQPDTFDLPFDHRPDQPSGTAQGNKRLLRDLRTGGRQQLVILPFAQRGGSGVVAGARLGVDGLHTGPQCRSERETCYQREQLQRIAPPV